MSVHLDAIWSSVNQCKVQNVCVYHSFQFGSLPNTTILRSFGNVCGQWYNQVPRTWWWRSTETQVGQDWRDCEMATRSSHRKHDIIRNLHPRELSIDEFGFSGGGGGVGEYLDASLVSLASISERLLSFRRKTSWN